MILTIKHVHSIEGYTFEQFTQLTQKVNQIMATQVEIVAQLTAAADRAEKARAEVVAQVAGLVGAVQALEVALAQAGQASPELEAVTQRVAGVVASLDDLNPDPVVVDPIPTDPVTGDTPAA